MRQMPLMLFGMFGDSKSRSGRAKTIFGLLNAFVLSGGMPTLSWVRVFMGKMGLTMWNVFIPPCLLYGLDVLKRYK